MREVRGEKSTTDLVGNIFSSSSSAILTGLATEFSVMTGSESESVSAFLMETLIPSFPLHFLSYFMKEFRALPTPAPAVDLGTARELMNGTSAASGIWRTSEVVMMNIGHIMIYHRLYCHAWVSICIFWDIEEG